MQFEIIILGVAIGLIFIFTLINFILILKTKKKYKSLVENTSGESLDEIILKSKEDIEVLQTKIVQLEARNQSLQLQVNESIQKIGFKRYNAFDNMGSNLSFSLSLLDADDNGIVISSLYGREGCTIYGKAVKKQKSEYSLSDEEMEVIRETKK